MMGLPELVATFIGGVVICIVYAWILKIQGLSKTSKVSK